MLIDQNAIINVSNEMHNRLVFNPKIETTIKTTVAL